MNNEQQVTNGSGAEILNKNQPISRDYVDLALSENPEYKYYFMRAAFENSANGD